MVIAFGYEWRRSGIHFCIFFPLLHQGVNVCLVGIDCPESICRIRGKECTADCGVHRRHLPCDESSKAFQKLHYHLDTRSSSFASCNPCG